MSTLEVNTINPQSGSTLTLGSSGNTVALGSGVTASGFGGGKIGQVIQGTYSTVVSFTGSTYSDTGLSASITPSDTSSKILCTGFIPCQVTGTGESDGALRFLRDSTTLYDPFVQNLAFYVQSSNHDFRWYVPFTYYDSPSTTSSVSYKFQGRTNAAGSTFRTCFQSKPAYLILQEVLA